MKTELMKWVGAHKSERIKVLEALKVGTFERLKDGGLTIYVLTDPSGEGVCFSLNISCVEFSFGILRVHLSHKPIFKFISYPSGSHRSEKLLRVESLEFMVNSGWRASCSREVASGDFIFPGVYLSDSIHVELGHVYGDGHGGD